MSAVERGRYRRFAGDHSDIANRQSVPKLRVHHRFNMAELKVLSENAHFGGRVVKFEHASSETGCAMKFNVFFPPQAGAGKKVPVLWFLSGGQVPA